MTSRLLQIVVLSCAWTASASIPAALVLHTDSNAETKTNFTVRLRGADARQQLLASEKLDSGILVDVTRHVTYDTVPAGIVKVTQSGVVIPLKDGTTTVSARTTNGLTSSIRVAVEKYAHVPLINFANQ